RPRVLQDRYAARPGHRRERPASARGGDRPVTRQRVRRGRPTGRPVAVSTLRVDYCALPEPELTSMPTPRGTGWLAFRRSATSAVAFPHWRRNGEQHQDQGEWADAWRQRQP